MFGQYLFPTSFFMIFQNRESKVIAVDIVIALNYFTPVCNVTSVFVEVVNFAMVKVDNFCKNKLIPVSFKVFNGKDAKNVVSKSEAKTNLSIWMFNDILTVICKDFVF